MEEKQSRLLKKLFWTFEDNIKDSKYFMDYFYECKEAGNMEMASYFLKEAQDRMNKNDIAKNKIENMIRMHNQDDDSAFRVFYEWKMEEFTEMRNKILKMTI